MESQLKHRPQQYDQGADQDDQHGDEKMSVLQKVKAKAKKIKATIKKHGHPQANEHEHDQHEHRPDLNKEDDDDEDEYESVEEDPPEVHGAPIYESQARKNPMVGMEGVHHQPIMERTDEPAVGKDHTKVGVPTSLGHEPADLTGGSNIVTPPSAARNTLLSHGDRVEANEPDRNEVTASAKLPVPSLEDDLGAPRHTLTEPYHPESKVNYPTGAGAEETPGIAPLLHSIDKMTLSDKSTESHDHFSKESERLRPDDSPPITGEAVEQDIAPHGEYVEKLACATPVLADEVVPVKDAAAAKLGYGGDNKDRTDAQSDQTGHTEKKASQTASLLADKAVGDKDMVASNLEYGGTREHDSPHEPLHDDGAQSDQTSYTEKASQAASFLANKAVGAKDAVASKLGYGVTGEHETPLEAVHHEDAQSDRTSYTEKASQTASLVANKTAGVKDAVPSKVGYGGIDEHKTPREPVDHEALTQDSQGGYVEKISGVTSAMTDKAVGAKNVVASKLGYGQGSAGAAKPTETTTWAEKLKPGDEDKALSELITGTVYKKESNEVGLMDEGKSAVKETISDSVHKQASENNDENDAQPPLTGKTTEMEAVTPRVGTSDEEKRGEVTNVLPGSESPTKTVMEKIKGAVSSLWSTGEQTQNQPEPSSQTDAGEMRLRESGN